MQITEKVKQYLVVILKKDLRISQVLFCIKLLIVHIISYIKAIKYINRDSIVKLFSRFDK